MNVVDSIFSKLKASRVASQASTWQQYDTEVVTPLADQKEIDAELCERFLKELGKVEDDLRNDLDFEVLSDSFKTYPENGNYL